MTHPEGRLLTPRSACGVTLLPDSLTSSVEGHFCPGHLGLVLRTCAARTAVQGGHSSPTNPTGLLWGGAMHTWIMSGGEGDTDTCKRPEGLCQTVCAGGQVAGHYCPSCLSERNIFLLCFLVLTFLPHPRGIQEVLPTPAQTRCSGVSGIATVYSCVAVALLVSATACHHLAAPSSRRGRRCPSGARAGTGRGGRG